MHSFERMDQLERRHGDGKIDAGLRLDAERLEHEGAVEATNQQVGATAGHDAGLGVDAVIAAGEVARVTVAGRGKNGPDQLALMSLAEIDAKLGDDACVNLGRSMMVGP